MNSIAHLQVYTHLHGNRCQATHHTGPPLKASSDWCNCDASRLTQSEGPMTSRQAGTSRRVQNNKPHFEIKPQEHQQVNSNEHACDVQPKELSLHGKQGEIHSRGGVEPSQTSGI